MSKEWLKLELSNLHIGRLYKVFTKQIKNHPSNGHGYNHVTQLNS